MKASMRCIVFLLVLIVSAPAQGDVYGRLIGINNSDTSKFQVRVMSTENLESWIFNANNKDIKNNWFTLKDSKTDMSLIIPWEQWNHGNITVQVLDKTNNKIMYQALLQDVRQNGEPSIRIELYRTDLSGKGLALDKTHVFSKLGNYCVFSKLGNYCDGKCNKSNVICSCDHWTKQEVDVDIVLIIEKNGSISYSASRASWNNLKDGFDTCKAACDYWKH